MYQWGQAVDLRVDVEPLIKMSVNQLKLEMKKSPKFLRTIRSNKAPIIIDAKFGLKSEPYNAIDINLIKKRAQLVKENEAFSKNILLALRDIAEEKEQSKSQEQIYAEESIYTKFRKKIIYQEAPDILPPEMFKSIKRGIAKRILSTNKEKWWTVSTCYSEIDTLREKYTDENDDEKLKFLEELKKNLMSIEKKYENA